MNNVRYLSMRSSIIANRAVLPASRYVQVGNKPRAQQTPTI